MARTRKPSKQNNLWDEIADIKREKILQCAVDLFYEKGYLPSTMDTIAEQLGATKPFVYYHFKSKIDLLNEISLRATKEWLAISVRVMAQPLDPVHKLALLAREFTMIVLEMYKHVSIYFREQLNLPEAVADEIAQMRRKIDSHVRSILEEGKNAGVFVFEDLALASHVVTGMVSYVFAWYREPSRQSKEHICTQMTTHMLRAVGVSILPDDVAAARGAAT